MFYKVDGQQRPVFSKGKSSPCFLQKVISPASEQHAELCPEHLVIRKLATPAPLCSVMMCLEVFNTTPQRIHTGLSRNSSAPQVGCISWNVAISCAVPVMGSISPQT